jgi:hypothetical protein
MWRRWKRSGCGFGCEEESHEEERNKLELMVGFCGLRGCGGGDKSSGRRRRRRSRQQHWQQQGSDCTHNGHGIKEEQQQQQQLNKLKIGRW